MSTHMKPTMKYENQAIDEIKRTQPLKRYSDSFTVDKLCQRNKAQRTENVENNEPENCIKYVPTRREVDSLVIDNYLFQRVSASTNKDGSLGWRCKEYRRESKCQSTCRIGPNGEIIRRPGPHNHPAVTDAVLVFMKAKADAKKRCRSENNISVQKIFLQEMGKAIIDSGIQLTPDDLNVLPRFEANKRCLQIQRSKGNSRMSVSSSDNMSVASSDDISVKTEVNSANNSQPVSPSRSVASEPQEKSPQIKQENKIKPAKPVRSKSMSANVEEIEPGEKIVSKRGRPRKSVTMTKSDETVREESTSPVENKSPVIVSNVDVDTKSIESVDSKQALSKPKKKGLNSIISGLWEARSN